MPPSLLPPSPEELEELRAQRRLKLPPGVQRATAAAPTRGSVAPVPGIRYPAEFIGGFAGANQRRSVMEPDAGGLESAYRAGEATSVLGDLFASLTPFATASTLSRVGALPGAAVIKPKGGNWLAGTFSPERALEPLRKPMPSRATDAFGNEVPNPLANSPMYTENAALNKWIDTKLTKYVKNEMATPEDPVRALAERGTLHFEPQDAPRPTGFDTPSRTLLANREAGGYPTEGLGKSNLARDWEALADVSIQPDKAEVFLPIKSEMERNPWLAKVSPDTPVYGMNLNADMSRLGFPHIIDELTNAMNPNSGLPASLRLTPQQLEKVTVPQAVERVAKINEWRAAQKAEADALKARNPATFEHRAYETVPGTTEPNEKGLRWVELRASTEPVDVSSMLIQNAGKYSILEPGQKLSWKDPKTGRVLFDTPEKAAKAYTEHKHYASLEDALEYEGNVMGHCVGGYCPDVFEGRSKIYSLRDKKGEPHVTIEVGKTQEAQGGEFSDIWGAAMERVDPKMYDALQSEYDEDLFDLMKDSYGAYVDRSEVAETIADIIQQFDPAAAKKYLDDLKSAPPEIVQIKGKGNKAPKDEYLPFVQDFVKSGKWSTVGDLKNTGLRRIEDTTGVRYLTEKEFQDAKANAQKPGYARGGAVELKGGGKVKAPANPNEPEVRGLPDPRLDNLQIYAQTVSREMFPKDPVKRDAARHIIASSILAQKLNPSLARGLGQGYELVNAPMAHIKSALGMGPVPAGYEMDTVNNALGSEMPFTTQAELQRNARQAIESGRARLTPDEAQPYRRGGRVKIEKHPTLMADELLFKGHRK